MRNMALVDMDKLGAELADAVCAAGAARSMTMCGSCAHSARVHKVDGVDMCFGVLCWCDLHGSYMHPTGTCTLGRCGDE